MVKDEELLGRQFEEFLDELVEVFVMCWRPATRVSESGEESRRCARVVSCQSCHAFFFLN